MSIGYPLMDLLLLGVTVRLSVGAGKRAPAFYLLAAAVAALFLTDTIYGWLLLHEGTSNDGLLEGGWATFYLLWGAAALASLHAFALRAHARAGPEALPCAARAARGSDGGHSGGLRHPVHSSQEPSTRRS